MPDNLWFSVKSGNECAQTHKQASKQAGKQGSKHAFCFDKEEKLNVTESCNFYF